MSSVLVGSSLLAVTLSLGSNDSFLGGARGSSLYLGPGLTLPGEAVTGLNFRSSTAQFL